MLGALLASVAMAVSILLAGLLVLLLAPRGAQRTAEAVRTAPFASAGWGVLLALALPILGQEHFVLAAGNAGDRDERGWETDLLAGLGLNGSDTR